MENTQPLALMDKKCNISLYISGVALEERTMRVRNDCQVVQPPSIDLSKNDFFKYI